MPRLILACHHIRSRLAILGCLAVGAIAPAHGAPAEFNWIAECDEIPGHERIWRCDGAGCFADNWSPSGCPGPSDTAIIGGGFTVESRVGAKEVGILIMQGGTLILPNDLRIVESATLFNTTVGGGATFSVELSAEGPVTLSGDNTMQGGTFLGAGGFTIENGSLSVVSDPSINLLEGTELVNEATVNHLATLGLRDATIMNHGTWNISGSLGKIGANTGTFTNQATVLHNDDGTGHVNVFLDQSGGMIHVQSGALSINSGGLHTGGMYQIDEGATLILKGFDNGGDPDGVHIGGNVSAEGEGTLGFQGDSTIVDAGGNLALSGNLECILPDNAALQTDGTVFSGADFRWRGGIIDALGSFQNVAGSTLTIEISNTSTLRGDGMTDLVNFGTLMQTKSLFVDGSQALNAGAGEWMLLSGNISGANGGQLVNFATIEKPDSEESSTSTIEVPLVQREGAVLSVATSEVRLDAGGTIEGDSAFRPGSAGTIRLTGGAMTLDDGDLMLDGRGEVILAGGGRIDGEPTAADVTNRLGSADNEFQGAFVIDGGSSHATFVNGGFMEWRSGTVSGLISGLVESELRLTTNATKLLEGTVDGSEATYHENGTLELASQAIARVHFGGEYYLIDGDILVDDSQFTWFQVKGSLIKTGSSTSDITGRLRSSSISAEVDVLSGVLNINGPLDGLENGVLGGSGTYRSCGDGLLRFPEPVTDLHNAELHGNGFSLANVDLQAISGAAGFHICGDFYETLGSLTVSGDATAAAEGGDLIVNGDLDNDGGTVFVGTGFTIFIDGDLTNSSEDGEGLTQIGGGDVQVEGEADNGEPEPFSITDTIEHGLVIPLQGGDFLGGLTCTRLNNYELLVPGGSDASGPFKLTGDLICFESSILDLEIGGPTPVFEHDQFVVEGDVTLDGTLQLALLSGYEPEGGEQFTIMTVTNGTISGSFAEITGGEWEVAYNDTSLVLTLITPPLEGDIDGDGQVNTADLLLLLAAWGACEDCPEDINGDGFVDTADLLALLGNWG
ncbi:MAG: hypothetical protein SYC29_15960 [Planctomycetota bacterium]|nr:hypothetical protein [Planctomycetota bacterium]